MHTVAKMARAIAKSVKGLFISEVRVIRPDSMPNPLNRKQRRANAALKRKERSKERGR